MGAVNGSGMPIVFPPSVDTNSSTPATEEEQTTSLGYTPVTSDLYYSGGYLGTLRIPAIGLSVRVYEGTDSSTLMKARDISKAPASGMETAPSPGTTGGYGMTLGISTPWNGRYHHLDHQAGRPHL